MNYITITGSRYYLGNKVFRLNQHLLLKKEYDNEYDGESIVVCLESGMEVGHVANSVGTVARGTCSAGRIYDRFEEETTAVVKFIMKDCVIAVLNEEKPAEE